MYGHSFVIFGWSATEVSVLGSQVFGQASVIESQCPFVCLCVIKVVIVDHG